MRNELFQKALDTVSEDDRIKVREYTDMIDKLSRFNFEFVYENFLYEYNCYYKDDYIHFVSNITIFLSSGIERDTITIFKCKTIEELEDWFKLNWPDAPVFGG